MNKRLGVHERGQALAEYMPIMAGFFALSFFVAWTLGDGLRDAYSSVLRAFVESAAAWSEAGTGDAMGQEGEHAQLEGQQCVVWVQGPGGSHCEHSPECEKRDYGGEQYGTFIAADASASIAEVVIKAGQNYVIFSGETQQHDDGCYRVEINGSVVSWVKYGSGRTCKDVSHIQLWKKPFCVE
jgi:hypothetical protein